MTISRINSVDGKAIAPSSVASTGAVSGSSVSDSTGSLADVRNALSNKANVSSGDGVVLNTTREYANRTTAIRLEFKNKNTNSSFYNHNMLLIFDTNGIHLYDATSGTFIWSGH